MVPGQNAVARTAKRLYGMELSWDFLRKKSPGFGLEIAG